MSPRQKPPASSHSSQRSAVYAATVAQAGRMRGCCRRRHRKKPAQVQKMRTRHRREHEHPHLGGQVGGRLLLLRRLLLRRPLRCQLRLQRLEGCVGCTREQAHDLQPGQPGQAGTRQCDACNEQPSLAKSRTGSAAAELRWLSGATLSAAHRSSPPRLRPLQATGHGNATQARDRHKWPPDEAH